MPTRIADADDPRLEPYLSIRERDLVGRKGRFVAEGKVVLRLLLTQRRFALESVLVTDARLPGAMDILADVPPDVPIYCVPQAVMDGVAGYHLHRGLLAIGLRGEPLEAAALLGRLPERAVVVGCVGLANHDNVGGIFRNAAAFGAAAVLLDDRSCDPLYRKAIRVSVGACLTMPFAITEAPGKMLDLLDAAGFGTFALTPAADMRLDAAVRPPRAALLLGAEGPGLPGDVLARVRGVRIPMAPGFDSLNVASASAVALHHFSVLAT